MSVAEGNGGPAAWLAAIHIWYALEMQQRQDSETLEGRAVGREGDGELPAVEKTLFLHDLFTPAQRMRSRGLR